MTLIAVVLYVPGAKVKIGSYPVLTMPSSGYVEQQVEPGPYTLVVIADGYNDYQQSISVPETGGQIRIGVAADPSRPQDIILPPLQVKGPAPLPPGTLPHLEKRGDDFVDQNGRRIILNGLDGFWDFRLFLDGRIADLEAQYKQSTDLRFNVRRVWSQGAKSQNQDYDLFPSQISNYYDRLGEFYRHANSHGIVPLITCFVDNQVVQSPIDHWVQLTNVLDPATTLASGFNQWSKNHSNFGPWDLPYPKARLLWSRGSDVDDTVTDPQGASFSELHSTRISYDRSLMDATASPPYMRDHGGDVVAMTEGIPADQDSDPAWYWRLGAGYRILWGIAVLHNRQTQHGYAMTDGILKCAEAWSKGMYIPLPEAFTSAVRANSKWFI